MKMGAKQKSASLGMPAGRPRAKSFGRLQPASLFSIQPSRRSRTMMNRTRCTSPRRRLISIPPLLVLVLSIVWKTCCQADAFVIDLLYSSRQQNHISCGYIYGRKRTHLLLANKNADGTDNTTEDDDKMLSELVRVKLEADHKRKFLKSRPRKLAYEEARTWVQRNLGVDTEEEFNDLVENGNLRTPYIPKRPEEYYSHSNKWISWDHFLKDDSTYGIKPASGAFD